MNHTSRQQTLDFIQGLSRPEGGVCFSQFAPDTILSTDFAVFTLFILGEAAALEEMKGRVHAYLTAARREDGLFLDPRYSPADIKGPHQADYLTGQFTCYTLMALDMLGVRYNALPFVEPMLEERQSYHWFDGLEWSRFWYESNKIMFHLYFLAYLLKYGDPALTPRIRAEVDNAIDLLNDKQDPVTGLWGTDLNGGDIADGAYGAAHILLFYQYFNRPIPRPRRILESCLGLHAQNGLAGGPEGGACEDYDLVEVYLRLLPQIPERKGQVTNVLAKMRTAIDNARSPEGGYPYRIPRANRGVLTRLRSLLPAPWRVPTYRYSSWPRMRTPVHQPDLWATFFRLLTLQVIDHIVDGVPFARSYALPGWGYLTPITA